MRKTKEHIEELKKEYQLRLASANFNKYRPFGHPDTLCPHGKMWKVKGWEPWTNKPWQLEFHNSGAFAKERAAIDANGVGKSFCTTWETCAHLMGEYPDWYEGYRFDHPVDWWIGSIDADQQRVGIQMHILGKDLEQNLGTGFIPRGRIYGKVKTRQAGIAEVADRAHIIHRNGVSTLTFKTYTQGWRSWQAGRPDGITLDEEPDENDAKQRDIFTEAQTRIFRSGGILMTGLTPLLGETHLTRHFMAPKIEGIHCVYASWEDAPHLKEEDKNRLIATYPAYVIDARTKGLPMMGEGKILTISEDDIKTAPFEMPAHYARIAGIDFGVGAGHPTAGAWLAWDRERDIIFMYDEYRKESSGITGSTAVYHAEAFKRRGDWIPVAWPHDGHTTSDLTKGKADGTSIKDIYVDHGVNLLPISARYEREKGGAQPQEPIIDTLLERMMTRRFLVFSNLTFFFEEMRSFHRKDGKIVNRRDDVIKAVLYALMMKNYAYTHTIGKHNVRTAHTLRVNYG